MSDKTKGIVAIILASLGFAFMSIFIKLAGDLPVIQKVVFRNGVGMIAVGIMITMNKGSFFGEKKHRKILVLRSALGLSGMVLYFYSISQMVTADANMLNKLSAFFLILFSVIFLKEHVKLYQVVAIVIAFLGSLLIIKPVFDVTVIPYVTSILAAMFAGGAYTVLRVLGNKEKYYTVVFFFSTFSFVVLLPFLLFSYEPMSFMQWIYLMLTGVSATVGQLGTTLAYKFAPARDISIFNYFNVVFVTILAIPILSETPDFISFIGYAIIFVATYAMFQYNKNPKTT